MKRKTILSAAIILGLLAMPVITQSPAVEDSISGIGRLDPVPAATLLLPYFEVDLADASGITTLMSVTNFSGTTVLAKVFFWTDLGVWTTDFHICLTPFDVFTLNLRDVFNTGGPPQPATWACGDYPSCGDTPPPASVPAGQLRSMHTGGAAAFFSGLCSGVDHGDSIARGYVTVDVANACSMLGPPNPGYFADGGTGVAGNENVLWGDFFLVDPGDAFAQGEALVHVEAAESVSNGFWAPGDYTFYGRYVGGTAIDNREPLGSIWLTRYLNGGAFTGGTSLLCWRDTGIDQVPFLCGTTPAPYPLGFEEMAIFDEEENGVFFDFVPTPAPPGVAVPCRWASTREPVAPPNLPTPFTFGWIGLDLVTDTGGAFGITQSYVLQVHDASGLFSVGYDSIELLNALCDNDPDCEP